MKHFKTLAVIAIAVLLIAGGAYAMRTPQTAELVNPNGEQVFATESGDTFVVEQELGSVSQASEYHGATLGNTSATGAVLKATPGTLGSVVMTGAGTGTLNIYNSTTTNVNLRALATSSLPILASFPASVDDGTYTFDIYATDGIVYEYTGVIGTSTITYR